MLWHSSEETIRKCVRSAITLAESKGFLSIAFPIIGSGSGGFGLIKALKIMIDEMQKIDSGIKVRIVKYFQG